MTGRPAAAQGPIRDAGKNHAMNTASVSTSLDVLLSHKGTLKGNKTGAFGPGGVGP